MADSPKHRHSVRSRDGLPVEEWHGGKVQFIRPHVIHLLRGRVLEIEGYTFFTMGGAKSHDIECSIDRISWWKQKLPSGEEYAEVRATLNLIILENCGTAVERSRYLHQVHLHRWKQSELVNVIKPQAWLQAPLDLQPNICWHLLQRPCRAAAEHPPMVDKSAA